MIKNFLFTFFFTIYIHVKVCFVKKFQQNMSLSQRNLKGVSIDLKLNNSDLSGDTLESVKTLPTHPRSHRYTGCIKKSFTVGKGLLMQKAFNAFNKIL